MCASSWPQSLLSRIRSQQASSSPVSSSYSAGEWESTSRTSRSATSMKTRSQSSLLNNQNQNPSIVRCLLQRMVLSLDVRRIASFQNLHLLLLGVEQDTDAHHHWDTNAKHPKMKGGKQNKGRIRQRHGYAKGNLYLWTKFIFLLSLSCTQLSNVNGAYPSSPSLKGTSLNADPSSENDSMNTPSKQQYTNQQPPQIHHKQEPTSSPVAEQVIDVEKQSSTSSSSGTTTTSTTTTLNNSPTPIQTGKMKNPPSLPISSSSHSNSHQRNNSIRRTNPRQNQNPNTQDSGRTININHNHRSQHQYQYQHQHHGSATESHNAVFLRWCHTVLGITGPVTIQDFEYENHLDQWIQNHQINFDDDDDDDDYDGGNDGNDGNDGGNDSSNTSLPTRSIRTVRGLAATRPISIGEVVISVPYHALLSIETTIDHDPVLAQIMGPEAREKYNWSLESSSGRRNESGKEQTDENKTKETSEGDAGVDNQNADDLENDLMVTNDNDDDTPSLYEISLMIVALLYHLDLGPEISPIWHYVESLLDADCDENMPFLYDSNQLREVFGDMPKIRTLARDIRRDVKDMYEKVMKVLIQDHGEIFGPPLHTKEKEGDLDYTEDEWIYSFDKFMWAFAMVNSRHWHLPVPEFDHMLKSESSSSHNATTTTEVPNAPPAQQPTDEFISLQDEAIKMEHIEEYADQALKPNPSSLLNKGVGDDLVRRHSFMVPLADMMNFGPPCTRGRYNSETKAFEVIATCNFKESQEITFWYSDDCEDDIIVNYGFIHPMIPTCSTLEDWKYRSDKWKEYAQSLEQSLDEAYEDHFLTLQELQSCNCKGDSGEISGKEGSDGERRRREPKYRKSSSRSKQLDL